MGCVANLTERKGHHVLLKALHKIPGIYLMTIGKTLETDYAEHLEQLRHVLNIEDRSFLLGHVEDVPAFLSEIDIFVLPTWDRGSKEGCPLALVEAMSSGRACIATQIPGSRDIIEHGVNGYLVPAEDVEALAAAINMLVQNPWLRKEFGFLARERIINHFSVEKEVKGYEALYQEVCHHSKN